MKLVFRGSALEIAPTAVHERRIFAEGNNTPDTAGLVLGAMDRGAELVLLNPRHFAALTELADSLEEYGDKAGALKLYRRALDVDPQMEEASRKVRELTQSVEGRDI